VKIIGGPALRSTSPKSFYLWLVLDERPASIEAFAYTAQSHTPDEAIGRSTKVSQKPTQLGDRLFVYLLHVRSTDSSYPLDSKLYYNVYIDGNTLRAESLFHGDQPLTYGNNTLPSLVIPTKHTRIVHMSCRKPHGGDLGDRDMTGKIDQLIEQHLDDPDQRPSMLFGTGDQIYGDDVAAPLLCGLESLARDYTGWTEIAPGPRGKRPFTPSDIKLGRRDSKLHSKRGFTSPKRGNHLITFGEYMCMYLAVLGGLPVEMPAYKAILDRIPLTSNTSGHRRVRVPVITRDDYEHERSHVRRFLENAWRLRRVMANVPTYSIFDDHEVSDDWNLTRDNRNELRKSGTLGRRVQTNALAAYWACQGYGNNPPQFDDSFRRTLTDFLMAKSVDGGEDFENRLLDEHWAYRVDGYPVTFVLDTRTQRSYPSSQKFSSLMNPDRIRELGAQIEAANVRYSADIDGQSLLIVSAAPVLGFMALERLQLGASFIPNLIDGECWIGSEPAYAALKRAIAKTRFRECSLLSGDVHYAFTRKLDLENADGAPLSVFQFTSSATHNAPGGARRFFIELFEKRDLRKFNRENTPYLFPHGLEGKQFVAGENNVGLIEFDNGRPVKNFVYFNDSATDSNFSWEYRLNDPIIVDFS
jgi:hypothetical protein